MRVTLGYETRPAMRCLVCGVELPRPWWARGPLARLLLPLCAWGPPAAACRERAGR